MNASVCSTEAASSPPVAGKTAAATPTMAASGNAQTLSQSWTTTAVGPAHLMFCDSQSQCPTTLGSSHAMSRWRAVVATSVSQPGSGKRFMSTSSAVPGAGHSSGLECDHHTHGGGGLNVGTD